MKDNIILIGLMGAGKTTVGRYMANLWAMNFIDFDEEISKNLKMSINEIFKKYGERHFRKLEKGAIQKYSTCKNFVISTGGGIVEDIENIENLKKIGCLVYLKAAPEVLYERIKDDTSRPLLKTKDPKRELFAIYEKRRKNYEMADIMVNTENMTTKEIVSEIYEKINRKFKR